MRGGVLPADRRDRRVYEFLPSTHLYEYLVPPVFGYQLVLVQEVHTNHTCCEFIENDSPWQGARTFATWPCLIMSEVS